MALISINGVALPTPCKDGYKVTQSDIDAANSGRNESGTMKRSRVRQGVYNIEYSAKNISQVQLATVLSATKPSEFPVSFFFGTQKSATMYSGDRSTELSYIDGGKSYWNVSVKLIEI